MEQHSGNGGPELDVAAPPGGANQVPPIRDSGNLYLSKKIRANSSPGRDNSFICFIYGCFRRCSLGK